MGVEGKVIAGRGAPLSFPIPSAASKASFTHPFYLLSSLGERINLPQVPSPPPDPQGPCVPQRQVSDKESAQPRLRQEPVGSPGSSERR